MGFRYQLASLLAVEECSFKDEEGISIYMELFPTPKVMINRWRKRMKLPKSKRVNNSRRYLMSMAKSYWYLWIIVTSIGSPWKASTTSKHRIPRRSGHYWGGVAWCIVLGSDLYRHHPFRWGEATLRRDCFSRIFWLFCSMGYSMVILFCDVSTSLSFLDMLLILFYVVFFGV